MTERRSRVGYQRGGTIPNAGPACVRTKSLVFSRFTQRRVVFRLA